MTEFEKQMLAMMQELKASMGSLEMKVDSLEKRMDALEAKMEAGFAELREADAVIIEGIGKIEDKHRYATTERAKAVEAVVTDLVFDVALLKRKVG